MKTSALCERPRARAWRHEIKFPASETRALALAAALAPLLRADEHAGPDGRYAVNTLYFDGPGFADYYDKESGSQLRQKARLRGYGDGGEWKLELKIKLDDLNLKRSCSLEEAAARAVARGDLSALESARGSDAEYIRAFMRSRAYRPAVVIKYQRRALLAADGGFRLTVDTAITRSSDPQSLFCERGAGDFPLGSAVIEVKYGDFLPSWLTRELARLGVSGSEFSKYSLGCASALGYIL